MVAGFCSGCTVKLKIRVIVLVELAGTFSPLPAHDIVLEFVKYQLVPDVP